MIPFVLSALGIFALINFPMLTAPEVWKSRIDTEVARLQAEDVPNRRPIPHGVYFPLFGKHASPFLLGLLAVYLLWIWKRKLRLSPAEWTLLLLPALNIALLSFIPTKSDRYILPTNVLAAAVAAAGLVPLLRWKHGRWLATMVVVAVIVWQAPRVQAEDAAFGSRRHDEVLEFVQARLPSSSVVLVDNFQSFPPPSRKNPELRQRVLRPGETLETLREEGVTHVLVTDRRYPVFTADSRKASGLSAEEEEQMRALYADIFDRCILIIGWEAGRKKQLEPEFRLYELPK
jgi:hypothetical protein